MTAQITILFSDILASVHADLALLGKRLRTKDGTTLFQGLTVSSVEDSVLIEHARQGVTGALVRILKFVQGITSQGTGISFRVSNTRWTDEDDDVTTDSDFGILFQAAFERYVVAYVLYEYLSTVVPADALPQSYADRYIKDMTDRITVINELLSHKEPVVLDGSFDDITATAEDYPAKPTPTPPPAPPTPEELIPDETGGEPDGPTPKYSNP